MEMPKSIITFERVFLFTVFLGLINIIVTSKIDFTNLDFFIQLGSQSLTFIILTFLVFLTSRKKSVIAKWIITLMFMLGLIMMSLFFNQIADQGLGIMEILQMLLQVILQAYGVYLLFTKDSKAWFAS